MKQLTILFKLISPIKDLIIVQQSNEETDMNKLVKPVILTMLILCVLHGSCAYAQTYEKARVEQVSKVMKTDDGVRIKNAVKKFSVKYGLEETLIHAVIMTESSYNKNAKSCCGAIGLMQLMPNTFNARNISGSIWNIESNIEAGVKHLAGLKAKYDGNIYLALAAYNWGGGALDRNNKVMPPSVKQYVNRVMYHKTILDGIQL